MSKKNIISAASVLLLLVLFTGYALKVETTTKNQQIEERIQIFYTESAMAALNTTTVTYVEIHKSMTEMYAEEEAALEEELIALQEAEEIEMNDASNHSATNTPEEYVPNPNGCLTKTGGVFNGPSGKETYYNLPMGLVVQYMRDLGYSEEEYPYWEREDGCKMFGDYIMVAADLSIRPKGTILDCSLGQAIVCDTGGFAETNHEQLDIAVTW